ncbi:helix-turn-helix domain-containing protein [Burkholderia ubonensis]|uniref:helix-turn-helix domain-containing protein n=1 Tax=Burkholderia ubonensis TaxID=101571 RepID=UPI000A91777E|nr:helix-turn-helix transcriptional regulator [Burkholderia ubonensis]
MLDTKKILADNLTQLLAGRPDVSRLNLSKQIHVADGTLGRIKYGTGNPTIEILESIARFFKIEPWQLLVPDLGRKLLSPRSEPPPTIVNENNGLVVNEIPGLDRIIEKAVEIAVKKVLEEHIKWGSEQHKTG